MRRNHLFILYIHIYISLFLRQRHRQVGFVERGRLLKNNLGASCSWFSEVTGCKKLFKNLRLIPGSGEIRLFLALGMKLCLSHPFLSIRQILSPHSAHILGEANLKIRILKTLMKQKFYLQENKYSTVRVIFGWVSGFF